MPPQSAEHKQQHEEISKFMTLTTERLHNALKGINTQLGDAQSSLDTMDQTMRGKKDDPTDPGLFGMVTENTTAINKMRAKCKSRREPTGGECEAKASPEGGISKLSWRIIICLVGVIVALAGVIPLIMKTKGG